MARYSSNSGIQQTIEALLALGCPPIPVAPKHDPRHSGCHRIVETDLETYTCWRDSENQLKRSSVQGKWKHCVLDKDFNPLPLFTGKNPSYLDRQGKPHTLNHRNYQDKLPTEWELRNWFVNPQTGVGTLGGHASIVWVDFDAKDYTSVEECDRDVERILDATPALKNSWIERTGSDGWRIAVKTDPPGFTNFTTTPDGPHRGEALHYGRFTVLAPTIHPNGRSYRNLHRAEPIWIESLETISVLPAADEKTTQKRKSKPHNGVSKGNASHTPTDPTNNPWDIRNFAYYLEGHTPNGRKGADVCKCPAHAGTSYDSLHIYPNGSFKCWAGCDPKNIYREALNIAKLSGYKVPEAQSDRTSEPEPDAQEYAAYQQAEAERERVFQAEAQERDREKQEQKHKWYQAYPDRVRQEWRRLKSFTKFTIEIAQRFLGINLETDLLPGITGIKSGMGTGKTEFIKELVKQFPRGNVISYRNALLQNTTARIPGIDFIHDLEVEGESQLNKSYRNQSNWTAACVDSIGKLQPKKLLVLEEVQKLINHLLRGKTCKRERAFILKRFEEFCQKAEFVILLDADLTDIELNYIQSLCPGKKVWGIQNTFIPWQWDIYWYTGNKSQEFYNPLVRECPNCGVSNHKTTVVCGNCGYEMKEEPHAPPSKPNDRKILESRIIGSIAAGEIPLIVSDSQQWLEAIQRLLESLYPFKSEVFRVDSFTKADDPERVNAFLANPDAWLAANQPAAVLLSPTAESSLDISAFYFTHVYGMFAGNIDCFSARQMLGRYRQNVERHIFIKEFARKDDRPQNSPLAKVVSKYLHQYEQQTIEQIALEEHLRESAKDDPNFFDLLQALNEIVDFKTETWKDPHLKAWGDYQARDNYQKANLRKTLLELLKDAGHQIVDEIFGISEQNRVSAERKTILQERAAKISESPDIDIEEARQIMQDMAATSAQRFAAEKAILKEKLPGVDLTPDFVYWCKYENNKILGALQNYWMMQHPDCREYLDRETWKKTLLNSLPLWDVHTRALELSVLDDLDLWKLEDCEFSSDSPEIKDFHQRAIAHSRRVKLALGITVTTESDPIYLARRCLEKLGYEMRGKQVRNGDSRVRVYTVLSPENNPKSADVLAAYDVRYADLLAKVKTPDAEPKVSQTAYQREYTPESQSVTNVELIAVAISQPLIEEPDVDCGIDLGIEPIQPDPTKWQVGQRVRIRDRVGEFIIHTVGKLRALVWPQSDGDLAIGAYLDDLIAC